MTNKWSEYVKERTITFEDVPKLIKDDWTVTVSCTPIATSNEIYAAILNNAPNYKNVSLGEGVALFPTPNSDIQKNIDVWPNIKGLTAFALGPFARELYKQKLKNSVFTQAHDAHEGYGEVTNMWIIHTTRPDKHGYVNLSLFDFMQSSSIRRGREVGVLKTVVAEINDQVPNVYGESKMHVSEIDYFINISRKPDALPALPPPAPEDISMAEYVAAMIKDRDTLQVGIGPVPETVASLLEGKHDLGISTEMMANCHMDMIEKGIITNKYKPVYTGISTFSFAMGDDRLYEYVTENESAQILPAIKLAHPMFIAQHPNFVAINSALLIDLTGQSTCEGVGHRMISGVGGQFSFQIGSRFSPGGRAIQLFRAANVKKSGEIESSIVPELPPGTPVSVQRYYADIVVTEYGVANLRTLNARDRADALIAISHPDVRGELRKAARKNMYPAFAQSETE